MSLTLGLDFGTDSVRALLVDTDTGTERATAIAHYSRWASGEYCDPARQQYRQHPFDYHEAMTTAVREAMKNIDGNQVIGIGVDTTGSTVVPVNRQGIPLALLPGFTKNPNAQFILWKDHTAVAEAEAINRAARAWTEDYTRYSGGVYSSEWFWAKILHVSTTDGAVAKAAHSWIEHCDYIPFLLSGEIDLSDCKRSRCAAGHKALWHPEWGGLPSEAFLASLSPVLGALRDRLYTTTYTADQVAGKLGAEWAQRLGLPVGIPIAVGAFDAHMGAVGGGIEPFQLSRIMGTSTCDILTAPADQLPPHPVRGICGQVAGSILPGMTGLEAGQSAFGDLYAWWTKLLSTPAAVIIEEQEWLPEEDRKRLVETLEREMIVSLTTAAAALPPDGEEMALDWINGRRTPDADQRLKGALNGLTLGTDAPRVFRALVEASCFGARAIVERFEREGIPIKSVVGTGGVAKKSPYVMQTLADVLQRPVRIVRSEQTCALGAAMFAAVAAGAHANVSDAVRAMNSGFDRTYDPDEEKAEYYHQKYQKYTALAAAVEPLHQADA